MSRNALGRGLSALIRDPTSEPQPLQPAGPPPTFGATGAAAATAPALAPTPLASDGLLHVDIDLIEPSPYQPRTQFREAALEELAQSIRATGIVQPLVVRRIEGRFQLIAGERRWRAAQRAQLARVPIVIRDVPDSAAMEMTLVENLQREDLNPIEQAHAFQRLTDEFHFTQEQVADRTGKDRATIANAVRLLKLEEPIQQLLSDGLLSAGHGRALLAIPDSPTRLDVARRAAKGGMTVRQVERWAARGPKPAPVPQSRTVDPNTKSALEDLQQRFGTRVLLQANRAGAGGHLIFEYYQDSDLARLYDLLMRD
jgi:ParB family transcriptional regulator, chromosome partitioning protein